jgi:hypothetical protein
VGNFTILTLIVAPAVLTNASSVLALNTANRFGRVIDRSRALALEIEQGKVAPEWAPMRLAHVKRLSQRALLLIRAQSRLYAALGLFVATAVISVIGAALGAASPTAASVASYAGLVVGVTASIALLSGCFLIVRETRLAVLNLSEEGEMMEKSLRAKIGPPAT